MQESEIQHITKSLNTPACMEQPTKTQSHFTSLGSTATFGLAPSVTSAFTSKLNNDVQTYFCVSLTIPHFGVQVFNRQFIASPCDFIFLRLSSAHLQIAVDLKA